MTLTRYVQRQKLYRVQVKGKNCYYRTELTKFKIKYPHGLPKRNTADHRKGTREEQPVVSKSIEALVNKYFGSADQRAYKKRYSRE